MKTTMRKAVSVLSLAWLSACSGSGEPPSRQDEAPLAAVGAAPLAVRWTPRDHTVATGGAFFANELALTNTSSRALGRDFRLYFSFARRILDDGQGQGAVRQDLAKQGLRIEHGDAARSGDYWVLTPRESFAPIAPGETRVVSFFAENWAIQKSDAPAGFHLVVGDGPARAVAATVVLDATDPKQTTRFEGDVLPVQTPARRYAENAATTFEALTLAEGILPTPQSIVAGRGAWSPRARPIRVHADRQLASEVAYLGAVLDATTSHGIRTTHRAERADVRLRLDARLDPEGYRLTVDPSGIAIVGADAAGVFYGIQSLRQMLLAAPNALPSVTITDAPLFPHRGLTLDVARHFQPKATVLKVLDLLALHKLNVLHLHLTDDEGFRLEIPGLPELTSHGARRGFDPLEATFLHAALGSSRGLLPGDGIAGKPPTRFLSPPQGFDPRTINFVGEGWGHYSASDFEDILRYAKERHIDVIPEVDVPGHARAMVLAMEHRFARLRGSDPVAAAQYRLVDPDDTSAHTSVQGYRDNFVNPCLDTTYAFLSKVVNEIRARYDAAGATLGTIHGGGDELPALGANVWWQGSPRCKANPDTHDLDDEALRDTFFQRWSDIVASVGARMTGWDDVIHGGLALPGFVPMPWSNVWGWGREDDAYRYANEGRDVVLAHATNLYMDLAYEKDPEEPGYYWANFVDERKTFAYSPFDIYANATEDRMGHALPASMWSDKTRLTAAGRAHVLGLHGLLWGESQKSPELLEYFAFPKLLGIAERAWTRTTPDPTSEAAWNRFANVLGAHALPRLDAFMPVDLRDELPRTRGVNYRVPPPGAVVRDGVLHTNVRYPGFTVECSRNGGHTFVRCHEPSVASHDDLLVRTVAPSGRASRATAVRLP